MTAARQFRPDDAVPDEVSRRRRAHQAAQLHADLRDTAPRPPLPPVEELMALPDYLLWAAHIRPRLADVPAHEAAWLVFTAPPLLERVHGLVKAERKKASDEWHASRHGNAEVAQVLHQHLELLRFRLDQVGAAATRAHNELQAQEGKNAKALAELAILVAAQELAAEGVDDDAADRADEKLWRALDSIVVPGGGGKPVSLRRLVAQRGRPAGPVRR